MREYPLLQNHPHCPLCNAPKQPGRLTCGACWFYYDVDHRSDPWAERRFQLAEANLTTARISEIRLQFTASLTKLLKEINPT